MGTTTLSHIELNGVLGTELTVAPGQDVKIKAKWADKNTECPGCSDFVGTAFAGNPVAGCIEEEQEGTGGKAGESGIKEVDLGPAPTKGGTYNVVAQFEEVFRCGAAWNASASTAYQVIARVIVPNPPTSKEQCKKDGWKEFTDRNGRPFNSQGECVSYVASGGRSLAG